jgi:TonB family protein
VSRLVATGALSLLLHGTIAFAVLALWRGGDIMPPRGLYVILPTLDGGEGALAHRASPDGRGDAAQARGASTQPGAMRTVAASTTVSVSAPRRAEARVSSEAAPAMERAGESETPKSDRERPVFGHQRPAHAALPVRDERDLNRLNATLSSERLPDSPYGESTHVVESSASVSTTPGGGTPGRSLPTGGESLGRGPTGRGDESSQSTPGASGFDQGATSAMSGLALVSGAPSQARPRYSDNPRPAYPWRARIRGDQGVVLLSVLVNEYGRVNQVRVLTSSGSPILDEAATHAVQAWRFHPGRRGADPVASWVQVPIRFRLED